jgi:hypothetical protein
VVLGWFAMDEFGAPRVPGTPVVIAIPVVTNGELDDGDAEAWRVGVKRDVSTIVAVGDLRRIQPTTVVGERDIAPTPVIETAIHLHGSVRIELSNHGIRVVWTRVDAARVSGHRILRCSHS